MYAASQVPSGVLIWTLVSVTASAADALPAAATMPAATDIATKSRRERSPEGSLFSWYSGFSSVMDSLLGSFNCADGLLFCTNKRNNLESSKSACRLKIPADRYQIRVDF